MLVLDILYHTFLIFLIQSLLYITLFADLETYYISKLIVSNIKSNINNYIKEEDQSDILYKILKQMNLPETCIESNNHDWKLIVLILIITYLFIVITGTLIVYIYYPKTNILETIIINLIIFAFLGGIEYLFFINIIMNYTDVSLADIQSSVVETIKTGKVISV
jgi:hypothetical protein